MKNDILMELKETYNEARRLFTKDSEDHFHEFCRYFKLQFGGKNSTLFFTSSPTPFYASHAGYQHPYSDQHLTRTFFSHKDHDNDHQLIKKCCIFTLERFSVSFTANDKRRICTTWPSFPFTCRLLCIITTRKIGRVMPIISIRIVLSCFSHIQKCLNLNLTFAIVRKRDA